MKATNNTTQRSAYGFIATLFFLSLFGTLEAQGVQQRSSLTHARGDVDQALTRSDQAKTKGLQPLTPLFADPAQTNQGGRNASGGRDNGGEEPVVVVVDGYQSVDEGEVRVTGSRGELVETGRTNQGGRNASGGRDNGGEEPVVVVVDGYQSVDGHRVRGRDAMLVDPAQTNQGGRNASGGRDSGGEEPVVVVVDGYQSVDEGEVRVTLGGRLLDPAQTNQGGRNASGGRGQWRRGACGRRGRRLPVGR